MDSDSKKSVLITGASTGIGAACALRLDKNGLRVFAGVRNGSDGESLKQGASERLTPVLIDVTIPETIEAARRAIVDAVGDSGVDGLVNNAGVFYGGMLEFALLDEVRNMFEVNFFGAVAVTQALLPLLRVRQGRIVNISSASGLLASPFVGPYAASKFALEAITDSWRVELRPWGIWVAAVEPGFVETPMLDKGLETLRKARETYPPAARELYGPVFGFAERHQPRTVPAERVAKAVEHALLSRRPRRRYRVGPEAKAIPVLRMLPVGFRDWLIAKRFPKYPD